MRLPVLDSLRPSRMSPGRVVGYVAVFGAVAVTAAAWYARRRRKMAIDGHEQDVVDSTLEQTFPASDPPFWTGTTAG